MRFLVLITVIPSLLAASKTEIKKKCFAPVYCDYSDNTGRPEWLQVFPPPKCHWTQSGNRTDANDINKKNKPDTRITDAIKKDLETKTNDLNEKYEKLVLNDENQVKVNNELNAKYKELETNFNLSREKQEEVNTELKRKYKQLDTTFNISNERDVQRDIIIANLTESLVRKNEENQDLTTRIHLTEQQLNELAKKDNELQTDFQSLVEKRMDEIRSTFQQKLDKLETSILYKVCNVQYRGKCFEISEDLRDREDVDFYEAEQMCRNIGWKLANIYSTEHYNMIAAYLRTKMTSLTYATVWLGMTINQQTNIVYFSNGNVASSLHWFPSYPSSGSSHTKLNMHIEVETSTSQGMANYSPTGVRRGALCEF